MRVEGRGVWIEQNLIQGLLEFISPLSRGGSVKYPEAGLSEGQFNRGPIKCSGSKSINLVEGLLGVTAPLSSGGPVCEASVPRRVRYETGQPNFRGGPVACSEGGLPTLSRSLSQSLSRCASPPRVLHYRKLSIPRIFRCPEASLSYLYRGGTITY